MAVTKKQADSLMKQAKSIQKTFDKVKGKMTQSQMDKASASLSKATAGVKDLNKRQNSSKVEKAIPATDIGTTSPVIPPKPQVPDTSDMLGMNNASVLQQGLTLDGGKFVKDPNASDVMNATKEANVNMGNIASQVLGYLQPQENQMQNAYEDTYGITSRQAGREYRRAQQEVQQYTSQLNTITSNRDAAILALEDTGRGQTTGFIGGEQGRIQRQAAIAALPVQAQLAAAQGNLEIAKSHVDSLFQMKIKDIETEQAYKQTVANTWMSVANQQQSNLLNAAIADSNARAEAKKIAMNDAKQIAMQAIEYGQSSLAASVMKLDPTSPTYQQDVMNAMAGLRKPVAVSGPAKRDTAFDKDGNLIDMQTGEVLRATGGGGIDDQKQQQIQETLGLARELLKDDGEWMSGKQSAVGASLAKLLPFGMSLGLQGNRTAFENKVNTLKANLTLDNLSLLKGPMSDKDLAFLQAIGSSISTNMSEKEFNGQVQKVIQKLEEKIAPVSLSGGRVVTAPDGLQIEIID